MIWLLAGPLASNAWQELRRGVAAVDLLLVLGIAAAFLYSLVSVIRGHGHVYFEIACVVLVLVTLGRWFEAAGKQRATQAIETLSTLLPRTALRIDGGSEHSTPLADLRQGDCIRVLPGERIAADGCIVTGVAAIDEQLVTGESRSVVKQAGDSVYGGALNLDGELVVRVAAESGRGTLDRMVEAVRQARLTKGQYQRLADRIASWFLPAAIALALVTAAWHTQHSGPERGMLAGMAVLLIACPCALGLATPMAVWLALGRASQSQVLFRHGDSLEKLAGVRTMFFDKTGTLSSGECDVDRLQVADGESREVVVERAGGLARASNHPYAMAIARFAADMNCDAAICVQNLPGRGITGTDPVTGAMVVLGSQRLMDKLNLTIDSELAADVDRLIADGAAMTFLGWQGKVRGVFVLDEQLRLEAPACVGRLRDLGIDVEVLTGDTAQRAINIGRRLGVSVRGGLLPEDKLAAIRAASHNRTGVAMVGDGINDAPALAAADIGIAMGCGADVSREAAEVCLLGNDLSRVPWAVELARRTIGVIRQNLFWTFAYNTLGIGLAVTGRLNPIWASAAMMLSSFFVVGNSLRLGSVKLLAGDATVRLAAPTVAELISSPSTKAVKIPSGASVS